MDDISHIGKVVSVGPEKTVVRIVSQSACATCRAAGLCTAAEAAEKDIEVRTVEGETYLPGEEVEVVLRQSLGMRAVFYAFVIPLALLVIFGVGLSYTALGELPAGLLSLAAVGIYYLILGLFKGRFESEYNFCIRRKQQS